MDAKTEDFHQGRFQEAIHKNSGKALQALENVMNKTTLFKGVSLLCFAFLSLCFLVLINFYPKSFLLALNLGLIFLSVFTFLVLHFYFEMKKPEELELIREGFVTSLQNELPESLSANEFHLLLANSSYQFSSFLQPDDLELDLPWKQKIWKKMSRAFNWKDLHLMRELLLLGSVKEHIALIHKEPTDLEAHASLANAYMAFARLYTIADEKKKPFLKQQFYKKEKNREKFANASEKAIEELKILHHFSPKDPWVHAQLANCYRDLERPLDEIQEYEAIFALYPEDPEILFRLGSLYFQEGMNAKGLTTYAALKSIDPERAGEMISLYHPFSLEK
ncbi:MAG: hypothetical protein SNF33_03510 [Candidatus Algichlamydia australiensis]|nr:hypothetical protein [Chlamydiales bacterium]